ncbi:PIN domain-containing protein [Leptolyngbya sp. CCNP1308]|uniref:PIN domain-containing protein n=1 Tax=Leptolyngbya sp. CCNP1308 TaxID=3110255 RepID=UPI002B1F7ECD|nr:PIN domain-containing protein [Leptolyngbya sp. CCNP1308]MEA5449798.1 PIN domain-containing protein [Leptolyngbya sp. CCNP1308]
MSDRVLLDTNLWVYLYSKDPKEKYEKADALLSSHLDALIVSTQILGELYNVLIKKRLQSQVQAQEIIYQIIDGFDICGITPACVAEAIQIDIRYGYAYWDSALIATALLRRHAAQPSD